MNGYLLASCYMQLSKCNSLSPINPAFILCVFSQSKMKYSKKPKQIPTYSQKHVYKPHINTCLSYSEAPSWTLNKQYNTVWRQTSVI